MIFAFIALNYLIMTQDQVVNNLVVDKASLGDGHQENLNASTPAY